MAKLLVKNKSPVFLRVLILFKRYLGNEKGSISLLVLSLFLLCLALSLIICEISYSYVAKRELVQIGKAAVSSGAHEIDMNRYYDQGLQGGYGGFGGYGQVPLDCQNALAKTNSYIFSNNLRGSEIEISQISCFDNKLKISISSKIKPIFKFGIFQNEIEIKAEASATSVVR